MEYYAVLLKYALAALIVGLVALVLPSNRLGWGEILMLALTAALAFFVADLLFSASEAANAANALKGVGLGAGFQMVAA
jgi:hypothetical protein